MKSTTFLNEFEDGSFELNLGNLKLDLAGAESTWSERMRRPATVAYSGVLISSTSPVSPEGMAMRDCIFKIFLAVSEMP